MTITEIFAEARYWSDTDSVSYQDTPLLRRVNMALGEVEAMLIALKRKVGIFGDKNNTTPSEDLQNILTTGVKYHPFDSSLYSVLGVSIKDASGIWNVLRKIDEFEILQGGIDLAEYQKTNGLPEEYAIREGFIILYPAADASKVTATNGLKTYFQKIGDAFTASDVATGTKEPGLLSVAHPLLALKPALTYAMSYKQNRVTMIMAEIKRIIDLTTEAYLAMDKDEEPRMTMRPINFR